MAALPFNNQPDFYLTRCEMKRLFSGKNKA